MVPQICATPIATQNHPMDQEILHFICKHGYTLLVNKFNISNDSTADEYILLYIYKNYIYI